MTYCTAIDVGEGLVFCSDSLTNAGVDQVSTYSKMHVFETAPDRTFVMLAAGNLATTQGICDQIKSDLESGVVPNLNSIPKMNEVADYVGHVSVEQQQKHGGGGPDYEVSLIIGGQISGEEPRIMLVYSQGNHITTSDDTRFLQIGESKYGKPILDRIVRGDTSLDTSVMCSLVSMDSTMRSNLTVGPPIEVVVYKRDSFQLTARLKLGADSEYLRTLRQHWDQRLKEAFQQLPPLAWSANWDNAGNTVQSAAQQPQPVQQQQQGPPGSDTVWR